MPHTYQYPRAALTVDCVVFGFDEGELKVLLIQRALDPFKGRWALPGGFGAAVVEILNDRELAVPVLRIGIPDQLVDHASPDQSKQSLGLTPPQMAERIITRFGVPLQSSLPAAAAPVAV